MLDSAAATTTVECHQVEAATATAKVISTLRGRALPAPPSALRRTITPETEEGIQSQVVKTTL